MTIAQVMCDMGMVSVEGEETVAWGNLLDCSEETLASKIIRSTSAEWNQIPAKTTRSGGEIPAKRITVSPRMEQLLGSVKVDSTTKPSSTLDVTN